MTNRLSPGSQAPDFTLPTDDGDTITLSQLQGRKVIVYFYPAALTPGCTKQASDFTESLSELEVEGYQVIGISPDKPEKLARFRDKHDLKITLASDPDKTALLAYGAFGEKKMYGRTFDGVIRSTFVIDEAGRIELAQYNVRATGHVDRLKKQLGITT